MKLTMILAIGVSGVVWALCAWASVAGAADVVPVPPERSAPPSQSPPSLGQDSPKAEVRPSQKDPGMVKQPETVPHPDSVVTPPVVDPRMAVSPEGPTHDPMAVPRSGNPGPPPAPSR